ncbi:hypothetical protein HNQ64_004131 [Prosthecobacter dejongeii]|uniref:Uncharacterized protein n=1 Tax=Prosthecobacter dejongeii TaxID=48465 RepID=A0A7W7YPB3_9BACT|nr:hypothetical protein [Prosthecobacter dejongeii]
MLNDSAGIPIAVELINMSENCSQAECYAIQDAATAIPRITSCNIRLFVER